MNRTARLFVLVLLVVQGLGAWAQSDACAGATALACGAVVSGNTSAYTVDVAPFCGTGDGTAGGVWYKFIGTGNSITASLCGSAFDTKLRVYTGSCAALVCTAGIDDFCGVQSQVTWVSTLGITYYILVHGFGAATGAYTLALTCAAPAVPMCYSMTTTPYLAEPFAGTALTLTDDVHSAAVPIGFGFCYNGTTYTQCVISSNNYITFNTALAGTYSPWVTVAVPSLTPAEVRNSILNPWQDIHPGLGGSVMYQTLGVAPNRRFVVSYLNVPMFSCTTQLYTSQTILYEGSNCIGSHIATKPICTTWNSGNAVHALHNAGGTSAAAVGGRNNTAWSAVSQGLLFVPTCAPCQTPSSAACLAVVLPLELLHFRGRSAEGVSLLEWSTASEENTHTFTVERGADAEHLVPFSTLDAAGNSHAVIDYTVKDPAPLAGVNYYRLRTTDLDGAVSLSEVIAVEHVPANSLVVYPNPAVGQVQVRLPAGLRLPATLQVRDVSGRMVRQVPVVATDGPLLLGGLAPGPYVLELPGLGRAFTATFVVE